MTMISDLLTEAGVEADLKAKDKDAALRELVEVLSRAAPVEKPDDVLAAIRDREELMSTGIGQGVAIPHAKSSSVNGLRIAFGRSKEGIDFAALDGKPVYLFFLLVAPEDQSGPHVKALARISRLLKDASFRESLMTAGDAAEILALIREEEARRL